MSVKAKPQPVSKRDLYCAIQKAYDLALYHTGEYPLEEEDKNALFILNQHMRYMRYKKPGLEQFT